ncbi:MAG TPA: cytochrome c [Steroidobacteraceae bacterium]|nr:cytochrome c [Steroidobacteraceae bacterium]
MDPVARFKVGLMLTLLAAGAAPAGVQAAAHDRVLARGREIAAGQCVACHVVMDDQKIEPLLSPPAPAFRDIANRPDTTAPLLSKFVRTTHWDLKSLPMQMPSPQLSPADTRAVVQYILSLRRQ